MRIFFAGPDEEGDLDIIEDVLLSFYDLTDAPQIFRKRIFNKITGGAYEIRQKRTGRNSEVSKTRAD